MDATREAPEWVVEVLETDTWRRPWAALAANPRYQTSGAIAFLLQPADAGLENEVR
jgi:hypothetical protein